MTTIVATHTELCGDSAVTAEDSIQTTCRKVYKTKLGIIGFAGSFTQGLRFVEWYQNQKLEKPDFDDTEALILKPDGTLEYWDGSFIPVPITEPFSAIGSGASFALGALEAGAPPLEALKIARKYDPYTGGRLIKYKNRKKIKNNA